MPVSQQKEIDTIYTNPKTCIINGVRPALSILDQEYEQKSSFLRNRKYNEDEIWGIIYGQDENFSLLKEEIDILFNNTSSELSVIEILAQKGFNQDEIWGILYSSGIKTSKQQVYNFVSSRLDFTGKKMMHSNTDLQAVDNTYSFKGFTQSQKNAIVELVKNKLSSLPPLDKNEKGMYTNTASLAIADLNLDGLPEVFIGVDALTGQAILPLSQLYIFKDTTLIPVGDLLCISNLYPNSKDEFLNGIYLTTTNEHYFLPAALDFSFSQVFVDLKPIYVDVNNKIFFDLEQEKISSYPKISACFDDPRNNITDPLYEFPNIYMIIDLNNIEQSVEKCISRYMELLENR